MQPPRDRVVQLFSRHFGAPPAEIRKLAADGSSRTYYRLINSDGQSVIGGAGPDPAENRAFLSFSRSLGEAGLNVPAIYAADEAARVWLAQDLGDESLFVALERARGRTGEQFPSEIESLFQRVLSDLPRFQIEGGKVIDFSAAYPRSDFDAPSILWDLNYFKYHFLKLAQIPFDEAPLEEDFRRLTDLVLQAGGGHLMHRDFQSRNIMLQEGEPWFIDYQGGRRGALQYDVASLLYSATTDIPVEARSRLLEGYLDALEGEQPVDRDRWTELYGGFVLIRQMQAMGTYGYRGLFERRPRFVESIPSAARSLGRLLEEGLAIQTEELAGVFERIVERWGEESLDLLPATPDRVVENTTNQGSGSTLRVQISSFSYRGGFPSDSGEHGGGFVFDCRALPNPGREDRYRLLTGLDTPVRDHLDRHSEVAAFWENTRSLVEAQVQNYESRQFQSLAVAYGCTGGQHRSVYFAERLAGHLRTRFPNAQILVDHRERIRWPGKGGDAGWTQ